MIKTIKKYLLLPVYLLTRKIEKKSDKRKLRELNEKRISPRDINMFYFNDLRRAQEKTDKKLEKASFVDEIIYLHLGISRTIYTNSYFSPSYLRKVYGDFASTFFDKSFFIDNPDYTRESLEKTYESHNLEELLPRLRKVEEEVVIELPRYLVNYIKKEGK